jgi:hypothetical protein
LNSPIAVVRSTSTPGVTTLSATTGAAIIERQAIHRGSYASMPDLNRRIRAFIDGWNQRAHPFTSTKTAEQILAKADRKKTSDAAH